MLSLIDPWSYREKFSLPKLIINGTNDFYWATGALNVYWDDLPENKWALYVPNAGHDLRQRDGGRANPSSYVADGLAAFVRYQIAGAAMPRLSWKHEQVNDAFRLTIQAAPAPSGGRLWVARSPTVDFRTAEWKQQSVSFANGNIIGEVAAPTDGYLAFFGEVDYEIAGLKYHLSTQLRMTGKPTVTTR